jgi:hypothetical protein
MSVNRIKGFTETVNNEQGKIFFIHGIFNIIGYSDHCGVRTLSIAKTRMESLKISHRLKKFDTWSYISFSKALERTGRKEIRWKSSNSDALFFFGIGLIRELFH